MFRDPEDLGGYTKCRVQSVSFDDPPLVLNRSRDGRALSNSQGIGESSSGASKEGKWWRSQGE